MSRTFAIPVYQRRADGLLQWHTVGLGPHNAHHAGNSAVKLQRKLVDQLRSVIAGLAPAELVAFRNHRGTELRRVFLDFGVKAPAGRARLTGTVPLVCQPRWRTADAQVLVVFHPLHEERWFWMDPDDDLTSRAQSSFRQLYDGWADSQLDELKSDGKDHLRTITLTAEPRSLLAELPAPGQKRGVRRKPEPVLERIGADQTQRAIEGSLPLGMPRRPYRQQLLQLLCDERKRPVLLVGPPGVGKSVILNRWVADLVTADGFETHRNLDRIHHVWRISGKRIIAGMSFMGDWERRCLDLLDEVRRRRGILWLDDVHLFGRLGQTRQSDRNLAELFRGPLGRGELLMVGECTAGQLSRLEDDAPSFVSLFTVLRVHETNPGETLQMLVHEARELEQRHNVDIHPFVYRSILELGAGLYPWSSWPGKALQMLRQLVARHVGTDAPDRRQLVPGDLVTMAAAQTGLPESLLTLERRLDPQEVRRAMERNIIGQPDAVQAACDVVSRVRAGLTDAGRPLAVYLFTGPTGTGKTELAKCLAEYLYGSVDRLLRFDMSELSTADAPARLIGDRYDPVGQLTERIREQPFSLVLLDEIEKAHRSVLYLLLQLFDEGRLTDAAGNSAGFQNAVVVMTSNLGARPTRPVGFGEETRGMMTDISRAVRDFFPPELFNRIDRVVPFRPLSPEAAAAIATRELAKMLTRRGLSERNIFVYANRAVKRRIVEEAFDPRLGARTVKRYLEDQVGSLLTDEITRGSRGRMQVYRIYDADGQLTLHVDVLAEAEPAGAGFPLEPLLELPALKLQPHVAEARDWFAASFQPEQVRAAALRARGSDHADELYYFADLLAERVRAVASRHGLAWAEPGAVASRVPSRLPHRADAGELLELIAEGRLLARNLDRLDDPAEHTLWVELLRLGHRAGGRFEDGGAGLLEWMARAYAAVRPDWIESFACRYRDGRFEEREGDDAGAALPAALARRPQQVVLLISGLFARDQLAGERGTHLWQSLSSEPEIVRVDLSCEETRLRPRDRISAHLTRVREFEQALEAGDEWLPANPQALAPAVRSLRFQPPLRAGDVFGVEIEDFRTGFAGQLNVTSVEAAISQLLRMWRGRQEHR